MLNILVIFFIFVFSAQAATVGVVPPQHINTRDPSTATTGFIPFNITASSNTLRVYAIPWDTNTLEEKNIYICCNASATTADLYNCLIKVDAKCTTNNCAQGVTTIQIVANDNCNSANFCPGDGPFDKQVCLTTSESRFLLTSKYTCPEKPCGECLGCLSCSYDQCFDLPEGQTECGQNMKDCTDRVIECPTDNTTTYDVETNSILIQWKPWNVNGTITRYQIKAEVSTGQQVIFTYVPPLNINENTLFNFTIENVLLYKEYKLSARACSDVDDNSCSQYCPLAIIVPPTFCIPHSIETSTLPGPEQMTYNTIELGTGDVNNYEIPDGETILKCLMTNDDIQINATGKLVLRNNIEVIECRIPIGFAINSSVRVCTYIQSIYWKNNETCNSTNFYEFIVKPAPPYFGAYSTLFSGDKVIQIGGTAEFEFLLQDINTPSGKLTITYQSLNQTFISNDNITIKQIKKSNNYEMKIKPSVIGNGSVDTSATNNLDLTTTKQTNITACDKVKLGSLFNVTMCRNGIVGNYPIFYSYDNGTNAGANEKAEFIIFTATVVNYTSPSPINDSTIIFIDSPEYSRKLLYFNATRFPGNASIIIRAFPSNNPNCYTTRVFDVTVRETNAIQNLNGSIGYAGCGFCTADDNCTNWGWQQGQCIDGTCSCSTEFACPYCDTPSYQFAWADRPQCITSFNPRGGAKCKSDSNCNNGICFEKKCQCYDGWWCMNCNVTKTQILEGTICPDMSQVEVSSAPTAVFNLSLLFILCLLIMLL